MQEHQIKEDSLEPSRIDAILGQQDSKALAKVMKNSLVVDNDELISLLRLVESTGAESPAEDGRQHVYIRSFKSTIDELEGMVATWVDSFGQTRPQCGWRSWWIKRGALASKGGNDRSIYLRYVGTCTAPETPYDRLVEDRGREHGTLWCPQRATDWLGRPNTGKVFLRPGCSAASQFLSASEGPE